MKAPINKIIDFSTVDGPGCRSAIFFQGCNIHCLYCHNPETQPFYLEKDLLSFTKEEKEKKEILSLSYLTPEEVFARIEINIPFIRGITVSGGECSLYMPFLEKLFKLAKNKGLSTLMDSNGMVPYYEHEKTMQYTDGVMLDIKAWDKDVYHTLTGYDNAIVKKNLRYLYEQNKIEEIRIVYVPSYVDYKECLMGIKQTLQEVSTIKLKLIAFRQNGVKTFLKDSPSPSLNEMEKIRDFASKLGYQNIIIR